MTKVLVTIDDDLWRRARSFAAMNGYTNAGLITAAVSELLEDRVSEPLMPERTGMVFAAKPRQNRADVGPITGSDIRKAVEPLIHKSYEGEPLDLRYAPIRPVPKPSRKK